MTTTVAVYNLKGGVGKTATAVNLSWLAAQAGMSTLLWDLDPQGAASFYLSVEDTAPANADDWLKPKQFAERAVPSAWAGLDVVPASLALRHIDVELANRKHSAGRLGRLLDSLPEPYDLAVLDCAPSLSFASENLFGMADVILVPVIPTQLSIRAFEQLAPFARDEHQLVPFFSMVDRRRRLHRELIVDFAKANPNLLPRFIPYASDIEKMGVHRGPVGAWGPNTPGAQAYRALWESLRERLAKVGATA